MSPQTEYYHRNRDKILAGKREKYAKNAEAERERKRKQRASKLDRDRQLRARYNISLEDWEALFDSQDRLCAICETDTPNGRGWCTDHDHACCPGAKSCGKCIRGILCMSCNSMLGYSYDNPEILRRGIQYLKENNVG